MKEILKKIFYEFKYLLFRISNKPKILSMENTVDIIVNNKLSVSRYGEGELRKMFNKNYEYRDRLINAFNINDTKLLTCVSGMIYCSTSKLSNNCRHFYKWYGTYYGRKTTKFLGYNRIYGEACITRFYLDYNEKDFNYFLPRHICNMKRIWQDRNILFVEGEHSKNGVGNDLFDNSLSIRRIICPDKNSISVVDEIQKCIKKHYKEGDLVLVSSGYAGSIICSELGSTTNMQCVDIGNLDVEYIWFLNRCTKKVFIEGKNSAEAVESQERIILDYDNDKYLNEIIDRVI